MNPLIVTTLLPKVLDKFFPDPEQKQQFQAQLEQLDAQQRQDTLNFLVKMNEGQTAINLEDAKNKESILNRGWRPFICWGVGAAAVWSFLGYPIASFLWPLFDLTTTQLVNGVIVQIPMPVPEPLHIEFVEELLLALLGLTGLRSYDKKAGIAQ